MCVRRALFIRHSDPQSKLNEIHRVVLMNRLEQFKKRQREDAARVQAELGGVFAAGAPSGVFAGDMQLNGGNEADDELDEDDVVEEYEAEMSPVPVDLRALHLEERKLPIVTEDDYLREIVSVPTRQRWAPR